MGSSATQKLKEIEELRKDLGSKVNELEGRFPSAGFGRKAAMGFAGTSVAGTALAFVGRRLIGGRRKSRKKGRGRKGEPPAPSVVVNVVPKGAAWVAAAGLAAWAGFKIYESLSKRGS